MANVLIPKKSTVAAKVPGTSDLALGEIAINHADAKLYARHPVSGTVQQIGGGDVTIDTTLADLLTSTSGTLSADDPGADRLFFWDDSAGRATHLTIGTGLQISGTTLTASGGDTVTIDATAADVLTATSGAISADDAGADKLLFWDDSAGKLTHLELGTALSISGTTLNANTGAQNFYSSPSNYWIPASAWIPRTTNGCGVDSREIGSTNRQNFDELLFDTGPIEYAQALHILPSTYNNSTITARFYWTCSTSPSGGFTRVDWGIQGRALADDDALDIAFGTAQTVQDNVIATNDMHITSATSAVTLGGTPAANRPIQFQIYRNTVADDYGFDARLLGVEITFTPA